MLEVDEGALAEEARRLAPGLVGGVPPPPVVERYVAAHRAVLGGPEETDQVALATFAVRHPWSAPLLDAACGLVRPDALLRRKLRLLASVLEATPELADSFLPPSPPAGWLAPRLLAVAAVAACRALAGLLIYPLARRS